jgi:transposase
MKTILADPSVLKVEKIVAHTDAIHLFVTSIQRRACCPSCDHPSSKVHSRHRRSLADLPWEGISVRLALSVRKFFCLNDACLQSVFCERLPNVVAASARRTLRLNEALTVLGFALGGRAGVRAATALGLAASATTLLRRVRQAIPPSASGEVTVLGIDDWAIRRRHRYGAVLVDLERRRPIELLVGRDAQPLAEWLGEHPGVEIISRDRFPAYAEGSSRGAPTAEQVADRFHLLKNMTESFERVVRRHQGSLREAARRLNPYYMDASSLDKEINEEVFPDTRPQSSTAELKKAENRARRQERFETIKQMQREELSISVIARRMGMDRQTVSLLMQAETLPERAPAYRRVGSITSHTEHLMKRWAEGCFNAAQLYREIKRRGYQGCEAVVRRLLQGWREKLPSSLAQVRALPEVSPPAPRQAAWWLLKHKDELKQPQQDYVRELLGLNT